MVVCDAEPCSVNECRNFPDAICIPNFCGSCFAHFFDGDVNVTERCNICDDGSVINCLRNPCDRTSCPRFPDAECRANYCGDCSFNYILANGDDVTERCRCMYIG